MNLAVESPDASEGNKVTDQSTPPPSKREARANAAAAEAYAKSQRNWFARHKFLTGLGILILLAVVVTAASGGGDGGDDDVVAGDGATAYAGDADAPEDADADDAASATVGIGEPARDGKFEFTVLSVEPGPAIIGTEDFGKEPQGEFVFVRVKVENIGNEAQAFSGDNQYLYAGERKFSADTEAAIYLEDAQSLFEEINPGNALEGIIIFDVPPGTRPTLIEVHDSAFSDGVEVSL